MGWRRAAFGAGEHPKKTPITADPVGPVVFPGAPRPGPGPPPRPRSGRGVLAARPRHHVTPNLTYRPDDVNPMRGKNRRGTPRPVFVGNGDLDKSLESAENRRIGSKSERWDMLTRILNGQAIRRGKRR